MLLFSEKERKQLLTCDEYFLRQKDNYSVLVMCVIISVFSACVCLAELAARWREVRSAWKEPSDHKNDLLMIFLGV